MPRMVRNWLGASTMYTAEHVPCGCMDLCVKNSWLANSIAMYCPHFSTSLDNFLVASSFTVKNGYGGAVPCGSLTWSSFIFLELISNRNGLMGIGSNLKSHRGDGFTVIPVDNVDKWSSQEPQFYWRLVEPNEPNPMGSLGLSSSIRSTVPICTKHNIHNSS